MISIAITIILQAEHKSSASLSGAREELACEPPGPKPDRHARWNDPERARRRRIPPDGLVLPIGGGVCWKRGTLTPLLALRNQGLVLRNGILKDYRRIRREG